MSDALPKQSVDLDSYPYAPGMPIDPARALDRDRYLWNEFFYLVPLAEITFFALACLFNLIWVPVIASIHTPTSGPPPSIGVFYGILGGQLGVLSLWFVWSQRSFAIRLAAYCILLYVLLAFLLAGLAIGEPTGLNVFRRAAAFGLPLVSLAIHLPLWLLRSYFGWEIIAIENQIGSSPRRALSIADILVGTALASVAVSAARFTSLEPGYPNTETWLSWGAAVGIIAGISLASLAPIVFCTLRLHRLQTGLWILLGYTLVITIAFVLIAIRVIRPRGVNVREVIEFASLFVALATTITVPLLVARARGWRLRIA
jgi:hypothetical protein